MNALILYSASSLRTANALGAPVHLKVDAENCLCCWLNRIRETVAGRPASDYKRSHLMLEKLRAMPPLLNCARTELSNACAKE